MFINYNNIYKLIINKKGVKMNNRLKILLIERGLRQKKVSELVGVTETTLSLWTNNKTQPSANSLMKLMSVLDCTPEDIYGQS